MLHFPISTTGVLALLCVGDGTHVWLSNAACFLNKGQEVETGEKAPHAGSGYKRVDSSSCWMRRAQMAIPKEKGGSQESSPSGQPNGGQGTREQAADSGSSEQSSIPQKKKKGKGKGIAQNAGLAPRTGALRKAETAAQADSGLVQRRYAQARVP